MFCFPTKRFELFNFEYLLAPACLVIHTICLSNRHDFELYGGVFFEQKKKKRRRRGRKKFWCIELTCMLNIFQLANHEFTLKFTYLPPGWKKIPPTSTPSFAVTSRPSKIFLKFLIQKGGSLKG